MSQRPQVVALYKNFLFLAKDWPQGEKLFKKRLHNAFMKNKDVNDPVKIQGLIKHGEFVIKEILALYSLKKYRTMKNRYYNDDVSSFDKYNCD